MIIRFCLAAALLTPAVAMAQGNPGPYGKLFGRAPASSAGQERTTVEVRSSIGANFDGALLPPEGSPSDTLLSGVAGSGSAVLSLDHRSSAFRASLNSGATRGQYFPESSSYGTTQYFANALVGAQLSTRFDANASAGYTHSPFYEFYSGFGRGPTGLDNAVELADPWLPYSPYAAQMLENDRINVTAGLTTRITKRSSIDLSAYQAQTRFAQHPDENLTVTGYGARWNLQLRSDLGVHAGYTQEYADLRAPDRVDYDNAYIDAGIDFRRAFSLARRTTFAFNTTTSLVKHDGSSHGEFRVNGGLILSRFFRRTWQVSAQASRDTSFVPGFSEPLFSDMVGASLGGMFSTRLDFMTGVTGARGESSFSHTSGFSTFAGTARLSFALSKHVSAYGSYFAYWYEVPVNTITLSVPGHLGRQVVSVGLNFYVPVYEKVRPGQ